MDRASVLKRRVQASFPNYNIRGALEMKKARGKSRAVVDPSTEGLYLFAAVPISEPVVKTINAIKKSMSPIVGFALLPIESADMVHALSAQRSGKKSATPPAKWSVFIGQHRSGGLRQVITRDGQLAMTRMTPVADGDVTPEQWAQEVAQEFKSTVSYLSRFGYTPDDGTDLFVVASAKGGQELESLIEIPCNYTAFTVNEAARHLGMNLGLQEDARYADPLHAMWAGRKAKLTLPMEAADLTRLHKPRQTAAAAALLLFAGLGYLSWLAYTNVSQMVETKGKIEEQQMALSAAEAEYQTEVDRMKALGFNITLIQGGIGAFKSFEERKLAALPFVQKVGNALGKELRIDALKVLYVPKAAAQQNAPVDATATIQGDELEANLLLSFPPELEPEIGVREVNALEQRLTETLTGYTVSVAKQVANMTYTDVFQDVSGDKKGAEGKGQDYTAEIRIKGPAR
jgi:hypothetical protein